MKNHGLLIAAALIMAAIYILSEEDKPFTVTFTLDALPEILRRKIELLSDGMLITATRISKTTDHTYTPMSDKAFEGIVVNKLRGAFGLRESWKKD